MKIRIGNHRLVVIDSYNYGVQKLTTVTKPGAKMEGVEYVEHTAFFGKLEHALSRMVEAITLEGFKVSKDLKGLQTLVNKSQKELRSTVATLRSANAKACINSEDK